jgi:hypothetical protein
MRSWLFVVLVMVAATGKVVRAEPAAGSPNRVGIDGMGGIGIIEMLGVAARLEDGVSRSGALILRAGHLQARSVESETKELHSLFFVHGGYRHYAGWFFFSIEGGAIAGIDDRGWYGVPSAEVTIGAKSTSARTELGLSLLGAPLGISLVAHLGFDFATW